MLACHYSKPAREKIRDMEAAGKPDDEIVASFVKEQGRQALVVPPDDGGFASLAWWLPPFMVGFGLALIYWFIRRMRTPGNAVVHPGVDAATLERYKDSIEKDLAKLD